MGLCIAGGGILGLKFVCNDDCGVVCGSAIDILLVGVGNDAMAMCCCDASIMDPGFRNMDIDECDGG